MKFRPFKILPLEPIVMVGSIKVNHFFMSTILKKGLANMGIFTNYH